MLEALISKPILILFTKWETNSPFGSPLLIVFLLKYVLIFHIFSALKKFQK